MQHTVHWARVFPRKTPSTRKVCSLVHGRSSTARSLIRNLEIERWREYPFQILECCNPLSHVSISLRDAVTESRTERRSCWWRRTRRERRGCICTTDLVPEVALLADEHAGTEAHVKSQLSDNGATGDRLLRFGPRDPLDSCRALWRSRTRVP